MHCAVLSKSSALLPNSMHFCRSRSRSRSRSSPTTTPHPYFPVKISGNSFPNFEYSVAFSNASSQLWFLVNHGFCSGLCLSRLISVIIQIIQIIIIISVCLSNRDRLNTLPTMFRTSTEYQSKHLKLIHYGWNGYAKAFHSGRKHTPNTLRLKY